MPDGAIPYVISWRGVASVAVQFKFSQRKAQIAVAYLASKRLPELTVGKICKLLFLADKLHLVQTGRTITGDDYYAFNHGPVPSKTYDLLKPDHRDHVEFVAPLLIDSRFEHPRFSLRESAKIDFSYLSKSDIRALDVTIDRYGPRTFAELRALTHEMPEYKHAWEVRRADKEDDHTSVPMLFEEFFEQDDDVLQGALDEAIENSAIARAFAR